MTQARRRLGPGRCASCSSCCAARSRGEARWRGLLVGATDGTIMTVADSEANLAACSKQRGGRERRHGYPTLRLLALVSGGTRTVIDAVFGPVSRGELSYAAGLLGSLRAGMVQLGDRNFGAGLLAAQVAGTGADFLLRVRTGNERPGPPRPEPLRRRVVAVALRRPPVRVIDAQATVTTGAGAAKPLPAGHTLADRTTRREQGLHTSAGRRERTEPATPAAGARRTPAARAEAGAAGATRPRTATLTPRHRRGATRPRQHTTPNAAATRHAPQAPAGPPSTGRDNRPARARQPHARQEAASQ